MRKALFGTTPALFLLSILFSIPCTAKPITILVHPFENTGHKDHSWISAGMTDTVITDLTNIQDISVVSKQDRKKVLEELKLVQFGIVEEDKMIKIGRFTGAQVIFTGSYRVAGKRIRVHARIVNVETGKVETSTRIDGTLNGIFEVQDKVIFTLMGDTEKISIAGVKPVKFSEQDRKKIEARPKPSLTAYVWYAKGLEVQDTNPKAALANFRKAIDIAPDYNDALMEAGFIAGETLSLFGEALGHLEKAERNFTDNNETESSDYADLMSYMGVVYWSRGQLDRALEYYQNSQSVLDGLGLQNTAGYAGLMTNIGIVYQHKGQLDRSLAYYLKSKSTRDGLGQQNTVGYAILMSNIGIGYGSRGQLDRELEYYQKSKSIRDGLGNQNTEGYAGLLMNIGTVYALKGQFDRALEYFLKDKSIQEKLRLQDTADYASLMTNIGNLYMDKGQLNRALEYLRASQSIYDNLGVKNTANYANLLSGIGNVYNDKGQLNRAMEYYLKSKSTYDGMGLPTSIGYGNLIKNMAFLYEKQGKRDSAGRYYRMAYNIYLRLGYSGKAKDRALNSAKKLGY